MIGDHCSSIDRRSAADPRSLAPAATPEPDAKEPCIDSAHRTRIPRAKPGDRRPWKCRNDARADGSRCGTSSACSSRGVLPVVRCFRTSATLASHQRAVSLRCSKVRNVRPFSRFALDIGERPLHFSLGLRTSRAAGRGLEAVVGREGQEASVIDRMIVLPTLHHHLHVVVQADGRRALQMLERVHVLRESWSRSPATR